MGALESGSQVGEKLFRRACEELTNDRIAKTIAQLIEGLGGPVTKAMLTAMQTRLLAVVDAFGTGVTNKRREISITFRGLPLAITICSPKEELDMRVSAKLKSALLSPALRELPFEGIFDRFPVGHVDRDMIAPLACARVGDTRLLPFNRNS